MFASKFKHILEKKKIYTDDVLYENERELMLEKYIQFCMMATAEQNTIKTVNKKQENAYDSQKY